MRKSSERRIICLAALMLFFSAVFPASAAENAVIVEKFTTRNGILLYVKGPEGTVWEAAYQVGANACAVEEINTVKESDETIYTLILWDNSLSVMNRQGNRIRDVLLDVMANRASGEKFSIALINNETTYLTEYTDDYAVLKQAVEAVEGQNQDAYIIENLYEAILSLNRIPDTGYKRVILISDGMDAVEIGYSKAELDALMEKTPYPIYTLGMLDGRHTEELQNLFALSRVTGAEYFYMDELDDLSTVTQVLSADLNILRISTLVPEEIRDGSVQNSQLVLESGAGSYTLQCQVTLPFAEIGSDDGAEQSDTGMQEENQNEAGDAKQEEMSADEGASTTVQANVAKTSTESGIPVLLVGCVAGALALILIVVIVIVFTKKKKGNEEDHYAKLDQRLKNERYKSSDTGDAVSTAVAESRPSVGSAGAGSGVHGVNGGTGAGGVEAGTGMTGTDKHIGEGSTSGSTRLLFDEPLHKAGEVSSGEMGRRIILTDMGNAIRTYGCGIRDHVVIGRNSACCNLAIATDNAVSERHCEIACSGGQFYIRDLGSSNGTFVNGARISSITEVTTGTIIKIGRLQYQLTIE